MTTPNELHGMPQRSKVIVIGQGYVGLPVSIRCAEVGHDVVGLDVDDKKISSLARGKSYVEDIADSRLQAVLESGNFTPSSDYASAQGFDVAVISVPTPLQESVPDLTYIEVAAKSLAAHVQPGSTIILESTTFPGTTEELVAPIIEEASGFKAGEDYYLGYSPERINPGDKVYDFVTTPKVVSGVNEASLVKVQEFYDGIVDQTVAVSGTKEAELAKLIENTFRHVNIALVNELATYGYQLGINTREAIDAAATKPFGFMKFTPGPGVGGHCLPIDPSYLSWTVKRQLGTTFRFVELANDINEHRPQYVVERATSLLNSYRKAMNGSRILVIGLAYKGGTADFRESPALPIIRLLQDNGAEVSGTDPFVGEQTISSLCTSFEFGSEDVSQFDLAILITDHPGANYSDLVDSGIPVLDTRNVLSGPAVEQL